MNPKTSDKVATGVIWTFVAIVVLILLFLLGYILGTGLPDVSLRFLSSQAEAFKAGGGIRDQLFNSLYLLILTLIISFPIALGSGIYLSEFSKDNWFTQVLRTTIEILSSLPSIVVGLFGYLFFVIKFKMGFSILAGALALTFFNLPLLTRNIEDSLRDVPQLQREAGASLGLSEWKTIKGIVLPAALPGILTGVILSAGRVFGEAAALIYTAGQSSPAVDYGNWNRPAETLAVHIWKVNTEAVVPDASVISSASSAVLIVVILLFNFGARALGRFLYKKLTAAN